MLGRLAKRMLQDLTVWSMKEINFLFLTLRQPDTAPKDVKEPNLATALVWRV